MDEEIKKILEKNLRLSEEIYQQTKYIKNYVFWAQIFGVLKILIIVVPIILAIIYLPPILQDLFSQYKGILGVPTGETGSLLQGLFGGAGGLDLNSLDSGQLPAEIKKIIK